jgi:hypothetical protein
MNGNKAETKPQFAAVKALVYRGQQLIARCCSHTFARRIAAALNKHVPGPRGY